MTRMEATVSQWSEACKILMDGSSGFDDLPKFQQLFETATPQQPMLQVAHRSGNERRSQAPLVPPRQ